MSKNSLMQVDNMNDIKSKSTTLAKRFNIAGIQFQYQNVSSVQLRECAVQQKLQISNFLCKIQGNKLHKVTEIRFGDKLFTLEDYIYLPQNMTANIMQQQGDSSPEIPNNPIQVPKQNPQNNISKNIFRKQLFRKKKTFSVSLNQKRDTKNIVKNFIKAFSKWFIKNQRNGGKKLDQIVHRDTFNNNTIKEIIGDEELCLHFEEFLNLYAEDWIQTSRIKDKNVHLQAIGIYNKFIKQYRFVSQKMMKSSQKGTVDSSNSNQNKEKKSEIQIQY